jgi:chemotaxis protein methyltransferase CheR
MLTLSDSEFEDVRRVMFAQTGARLKDSKRPLIISRLRSRLEQLKLSSFSQYVKLLTPTNVEELEYFINALTTNETFFFRHTKQFNYLYEVIFPKLVSEGKQKIEIWSGASSTGEEPYSIAIALTEFSKKSPVSFQIHASDINSEVIEDAKEGLYTERDIKEVPASLRERYFKAVPGGKMGIRYALSDVIKRKVDFFEHNLQHTAPIRGMDIIFLRNVLIYFERDIKEKVVNLLEPSIKPGGYFFISLSENLNDIKTNLKLIESGIFQKPL